MRGWCYNEQQTITSMETVREYKEITHSTHTRDTSNIQNSQNLFILARAFILLKQVDEKHRINLIIQDGRKEID